MFVVDFPLLFAVFFFILILLLVIFFIPCSAGVSFTQPRVHGMVYEPTTGEAKFLDLDFHDLMENLKDIYDLYRPPDGVKTGGGMS